MLWNPGHQHLEERVKGVRYVVTEGDGASGGEHTIEWAEAVLAGPTPEVYIMLLTSVTQCISF